MPRTPRVVLPGFPHHLYLRGNNRRKLFSSDGDRLRFLWLLQRALASARCVIHQLTLMTNHVHLIATPYDRGALAHLVKATCQRYSQHRNLARGSSGKLFEQRYGSKPILDDAQLMVTTLYNDANAYRARLAVIPFGHWWSTGPVHAGLPGGPVATLWTPSPWYAGLGATAADRSLAYARLMKTYVSRDADRPDGIVDNGRRDRGKEERPDGSSATDP